MTKFREKEYIKILKSLGGTEANPTKTAEILKKIKENKRAIIFEDLTNLKLFDVSMKQSREFSKPISLGDGYLLENGEYTKIKTIKYD